jgi:hypothetical protein
MLDTKLMGGKGTAHHHGVQLEATRRIGRMGGPGLIHSQEVRQHQICVEKWIQIQEVLKQQHEVLIIPI